MLNVKWLLTVHCRLGHAPLSPFKENIPMFFKGTANTSCQACYSIGEPVGNMSSKSVCDYSLFSTFLKIKVIFLY